MRIIGTAGHVDHGKSSLVQALTGTNPDRWIEEQLRGMTLDLGFAHLRFDDGTEAGIVDVPGHERFLHNMLAGAAGMELLLLVVAADEGVMLQTLEHLLILGFLNVCRTIVVISKADLVAEHDLGQRVAEIREQLKGTIAQDSPAYAVSNKTGAGLEDLRRAIAASLQTLPARNLDAPPFLPVDRVFKLQGRGTIVTGTLMQGRISAGDRLVLQPSGRAVRVRTLQTFGQTKEQVEAGARVAANLPGLEVEEISRGEVLAAPQFVAASSFEVQFTPLDQGMPLLRRRNPVRVHIGSAEILGTLVLEVPLPRSAQLFLRKPTIAYPGMPFVLRRLSPKTLLGGGTISSTAGTASADERSPAADVLLAVLRRNAPTALSLGQIAREANLRDDVAQAEIQRLHEQGDLFALARPLAFMDLRAAGEILDAVHRLLREAHESEPWAMGLTSIAVGRALQMPDTKLAPILQAFVEDGRLAYRAGYYAHPGHQPALTAEQRAFLDALVPVDAAQPFLPTALATALARLRVSQIVGMTKAFDTLLAKGVLVKVNDDLYRGSQVAQIRARIESFLKDNGRMTMAQFRDLIGSSRKYAVPLLEWFDARGITVRSDDYRMLRTAAKEAAVQ